MSNNNINLALWTRVLTLNSPAFIHNDLVSMVNMATLMFILSLRKNTGKSADAASLYVSAVLRIVCVCCGGMPHPHTAQCRRGDKG